MSFRYYDIPIFALEDENEVEYLLKEVSHRLKNLNNKYIPCCHESIQYNYKSTSVLSQIPFSAGLKITTH